MRNEVKRGSNNLFNGRRMNVVAIHCVHEALAPFMEE
jgi:hypothetical protein